MQVILLEKVLNVGDLGEVVKVKEGYARNYLIPQGKAKRATSENIKLLEERRAELEKAAHEFPAAAEQRAAQLKEFKLILPSKAGTEGKLFGSIGTADIAEAATKAGIKIERSEVRLPNGALRSVGDHSVVLHLHADIDVPLAVTIVAEE